jgi:8-oxo-dGTP pyrophosphatase MutT (NUDIX family)
MPEKAYLIIHDNTSILVGRGGFLNRERRTGTYLPGGTVDRRNGENPEQAAVRELRQEMNIETIPITKTTPAFTLSDNKNVHFFVVYIENIQIYTGPVGIQQDMAIYDNPFVQREVRTIDECANGNIFFDDAANKIYTGWFKEGVRRAIQLNHLPTP